MVQQQQKVVVDDIAIEPLEKETKPISIKETALKKRAIEKDHKLDKKNEVGRFEQNYYQVVRILEKTSFVKVRYRFGGN